MFTVRWSPRAAVALLVTLAAWLAVVLGAPMAKADATFEGAVPSDGETVPAPVTEIELTFSDPIGLNETETRLLDAEGTELIYEALEVDDGVTWILEPALSLDEGVYGVIWQAEAADGHTIRGVVRFGVGDVVLEQQEPATDDDTSLEGELAAAEAEGSGGGGGVLASIAAAITNLGLIIGWGVAIFVAFVASPRMTWVGRYLMQIMRIAGAIAVAGALVDLINQFVGGGSWNLILAALLRLAAGAALAGAPGMVNGSPFIWVLSGGIIVSYALDGHTITTSPTWLMMLADATHVTFAAIWGGGIIALAIAIAYVLRKREERAAVLTDGTELVIRFSRYATYSVFAVAITGILMAFFIMPTLSALFSSTWGIILLIKIAMVIALGVYGARNHFGVIPELEYAQVQREGREGESSEALAMEREQLSILRRRFLPEMVLIVGILIASGLLVQASPIPG